MLSREIIQFQSIRYELSDNNKNNGSDDVDCDDDDDNNASEQKRMVQKQLVYLARTFV